MLRSPIFVAAVGLMAAGPVAAQVQDHVACYSVKDAAPKAAYTADVDGIVLARGCLVKVPAKLLCVPASKSNVNPAPPVPGTGATAASVACYKVKCPKGVLDPVMFTDQFGSRMLTPKAPKLLCAPALVTTTTVTTTTTTTSSTISGTCAPGAGRGGTLTAAEADALVAAHNAVRAGATPAPSPPLQPLCGDEPVANVADSWATQCNFSHSSAPMRPDPYNPGSPLGENIYATSGTGNVVVAVNAWASEAADYDYATNTCSGVCGHYTQIVWRSTLRVGCAKRVCTTGSPFGGSGSWTFLVCNYSAAGNVGGQRPY